MTTVVFGRTSTGTSNDGSASGGQLAYIKIGPLAENMTVTAAGVYCRQSDPSNEIQMGLYLRDNANEANSTLIKATGGIVFPSPLGVPTWVVIDTEWDSLQLLAGNTYILAAGFKAFSGSPTGVLPYFGPTATPLGYSKTGTAGAPQWPAIRDPLGPAQLEYPTRDACMYLQCETSDTLPVISNVNENNVVINNQGIVINGTGLENVTLASLGGQPLEIESVASNAVNCLPLDIRTTPLFYGDHDVVVSDGVNSDVMPVNCRVTPVNQYKTVSGLIPNGALKDVAGAANGDVVEIPKEVGLSTLTLSESTDILFSPAVVNGTTFTRWWYNGSGWDSGPITVYQGQVSNAEWTGTPSPSNSVPGKPYSYSLASLVSGDRPIQYTVTNGALPDGIVVNSSSETIEGVTSDVGTFPDIEITVDNSALIGVIKVVGD